MHVDARTLEDGTLIEGDVCIVGAGAAGISMALEWLDSRHRVVLLEGGGFDLDFRYQDLYRGDVVGRPYYPLNAARLRYFGGTTGHWAGWCSTLDPVDFEDRPGIPHSGWPIRKADLDPFYARAHEVLELGPYAYDTVYWEEYDPDMVPLSLDAAVAWTKMLQFSPPTRFGVTYREPIVEAPSVHLYTHANLVEIQANEPVSHVTGLRIRTLEGSEHHVRARYYVLACGAMQNARLLLASNRQAAAGLGNDHDLVGRFFMEHLEMPAAHLVLAHPEPMKMYAADWQQTPARGELALTAEVQRAHGLLNVSSALRPDVEGGEVLGTFQVFPPEVVFERFRELPTPEQQNRGRAPMPSPERRFLLTSRQEQAPNPDSRVLLGDEVDALGMPRVRLDWQLTDLDRRSAQTSYELLAREVGRSGVGRIQLFDWLIEDDDAWPSSLSGGWHHMGTARMHEDPRRGVVDANCKVHGLNNLYVAGSAVFATSGSANPTLSIVALSLRLSDHLKSQTG